MIKRHQGCVGTEGRPYVDTTRRWPFASQRGQKKATVRNPDLGPLLEIM